MLCSAASLHDRARAHRCDRAVTLGMRPLRASSCASASTSGRLLRAATTKLRGAALLPHAGIASPVNDTVTSPTFAAPAAGSWKQQGLSMADTAAEAADELQQWVRKELKRWGVEDSLAARQFLDRLNQVRLCAGCCMPVPTPGMPVLRAGAGAECMPVLIPLLPMHVAALSCSQQLDCQTFSRSLLST